ncbi:MULTISPECIES: SemiSWEET transporter [Acidobacterium]|uniref:Putative membane protein n=1 Tax=Acidobacterium capsulatum (strain ATCC 51196 / DSM 11244 / BCRC 80197 / JCM 7670 / NBRC 15755 / NCIMB 13165 / 161) TaxID=240015 RepID=C1F8C4_ACIC5|nr:MULTISPECIES: SemiSWEET transporter [Acidobacterium]ACO32210.1 putative membane protein [Acidobacterium capsulatum ATCC 51196]
MTLHIPLLTLAGYCAAVCTTLSFVPQLVRVWRLRSARDISLTMFLVFSIGVFLWLVYGISIRSIPVILANAVTLALSLAILILKLRFDRQH